MWRLFWEFFKLGLFTIGGGMSMIPQMQHIAVEKNRWLSEEEVTDCIAISQSLPGIIAVNMATWIGRKKAGLKGAVCSTAGVILPSFIIIIIAVFFLDALGESPWLSGAFLGVKAALVGMLLVTAWRLGKQILRTPFQWMMMIGGILAVALGGVSVVWVILAAALIGIAFSLWKNREVRP